MDLKKSIFCTHSMYDGIDIVTGMRNENRQRGKRNENEKFMNRAKSGKDIKK